MSDTSLKNFTFETVSASQGSFCDSARLNFQAYALRDMEWMSFRFNFFKQMLL